MGQEDLVRVTDTVTLRVRLRETVPLLVLVTTPVILVLDLVRVTLVVRERVTVGDRLRVPDTVAVLDASPPTCGARHQRDKRRNQIKKRIAERAARECAGG